MHLTDCWFDFRKLLGLRNRCSHTAYTYNHVRDISWKETKLNKAIVGVTWENWSYLAFLTTISAAVFIVSVVGAKSVPFNKVQYS